MGNGERGNQQRKRERPGGELDLGWNCGCQYPRSHDFIHSPPDLLPEPALVPMERAVYELRDHPLVRIEPGNHCLAIESGMSIAQFLVRSSLHIEEYG